MDGAAGPPPRRRSALVKCACHLGQLVAKHASDDSGPDAFIALEDISRASGRGTSAWTTVKDSGVGDRVRIRDTGRNEYDGAYAVIVRTLDEGSAERPVPKAVIRLDGGQEVKISWGYLTQVFELVAADPKTEAQVVEFQQLQLAGPITSSSASTAAALPVVAAMQTETVRVMTYNIHHCEGTTSHG
jgi:hypothetical protein